MYTGTAILLASGSQDKNIRVWRASPVEKGALGNAVTDDILGDITRLASKHRIRAGQQELSISLEAVLIGCDAPLLPPPPCACCSLLLDGIH
jgi:hypothetical protein